MTIIEEPRHRIVPAAESELERLERTAQALWSIEPDCPLEDRFDLMTRLSAVSAALDRIRVREGVDAVSLHECHAEIDTLAAEWTADCAASGRDRP